MEKLIVISPRILKKAAEQSLKMEGLSLVQAHKNKLMIAKLKQYGRAFSV